MENLVAARPFQFHFFRLSISLISAFTPKLKLWKWLTDFSLSFTTSPFTQLAATTPHQLQPSRGAHMVAVHTADSLALQSQKLMTRDWWRGREKWVL